MMEKAEFKEMLNRYLEGTCTPDEKLQVEAWYLARSRASKAPLLDWDYDAIKTDVFAYIQIHKGTRPSARRITKFWPSVAAAVAVFTIAIGAWYFFDIGNQQPGSRLASEEILPGGNRATLTLADGRVVNLDEAQRGIVIGAEDITYQDGTSLALSPAGGGRGRLDEIKELALTTPKGGTYQVTLPDGSQVWLNSASTLKYPIRFSDETREVILEGEAFFAVSGQPSAFGNRLPFKVMTKEQTVEVLGTQFNISAYTDDPETKTTLVEGKVRVEASGASLQLVPGEQVISSEQGLIKREVDTEQYISWRNGYFKLDGTLADIMAQVSRWYDVTVVFEPGYPATLEMQGLVSRDKTLRQLLELMTADGRFKYTLAIRDDERRLTISK